MKDDDDNKWHTFTFGEKLDAIIRARVDLKAYSAALNKCVNINRPGEMRGDIYRRDGNVTYVNF